MLERVGLAVDGDRVGSLGSSLVRERNAVAGDREYRGQGCDQQRRGAEAGGWAGPPSGQNPRRGAWRRLPRKTRG